MLVSILPSTLLEKPHWPLLVERAIRLKHLSRVLGPALLAAALLGHGAEKAAQLVVQPDFSLLDNIIIAAAVKGFA